MELNNMVEEFIMTPKIDNNNNNNMNPFPTYDFLPNYFDEAQFDFQHFSSPLSDPSFLEAFTDLPDYYVDNSNNIPAIDQEDQFGYLDDSILINGFDNVISSLDTSVVENNESGDYAPNDNNNHMNEEEKKKGLAVRKQPSKNLMAERRRRKRLNDRLSMLRSIVPKISKMDRTSILGDTIDYTKELLDKIHKLKVENNLDDHINLIGNCHLNKEQKPSEMVVRNPTKFDVERADHETRVEVSCKAKPGLLISTLGTLDALGLDIHQCVISCFSDFSLRASCHEVVGHRSLVSCEDIKQALFMNADYGGRCM